MSKPMSDTISVLAVAAGEYDLGRVRLALGELGVDVTLVRVPPTELATALQRRWEAVITDDSAGIVDAAAVVARVRAADAYLPVLVLADEVPRPRAVALMTGGADEVLELAELDRLGAALRQRLRTAHERRLRRAVDESARRADGELRDAIDLLPLGIVVRHGNTVAYVNRAAVGYFGRAPERLLGVDFVELVRADQREAVRARVAALDAGESLPPFDLRIERDDGKSCILELSAARHITFGGLPSVMLTLRDVTEERAMRERLQMADRMAAVGALAAGVAHEINNPLACVTANLELLREEMSAGDDGRPRLSVDELLGALDDAREGAERVRLIVRDLGLFARGDAVERGPVDLIEVLQAAERMAGNLVKARARVVHQHAPLPSVDGNASRLCQVFVHLLVNAAQAIAPGRPDENEVRLRATSVGDRVVVEVRDTGAGIPPEVRARIFDPFFSTKGIGGGHGLGLTVSHGIVTSYGGEIAVDEGDGGRGTVVRVTLPVWPG
jgi:PAS domain S-box-containing protein